MKFKLIMLLAFSLLVNKALSIPLKQPAQAASRQSFLQTGVAHLMKKGGIPGLTLVLVQNGHYEVYAYGYQDLEKQIKVTPSTLFQLGSCSKAFTALGVLKLIHAHQLSYDTKVSSLLPWLCPTFHNQKVDITLSQLLHHTTGFSWKTISGIPQSDGPNALEETVRKVSAAELSHEPGKQFEYATINYDILALLIQKVTGRAFEDYLQNDILNILHLRNTTIGRPSKSDQLAEGYKISFFHPQVYHAPVFKGNNAAGYVISNGDDMGKWLLVQLGISDTSLSGLANESQLPDYSVAPVHDAYYAMGWQIPLNGRNEAVHSGLNPNYTSFVGFDKSKKVGIAVLANSNSGYTDLIGRQALDLLEGQTALTVFQPDGKNDSTYSIVCVILSFYILLLIGYAGYCLIGLRKGNFYYRGWSAGTLLRTFKLVIMLSPFLIAIYFLPRALVGFTWSAMFVWNPLSFEWLLILLCAAIAISTGVYFFNLLFSEKNKYKRMLPSVVLMSVLSGLANMVIIVTVNAALSGSFDILYLVFYYVLMLFLYLGGRKYVQSNMITYTNDLICDIRKKLIGSLMKTTFRHFDQIDRGRILATTNDDVTAVGQSANILINLFTSLFSSIAAFLYLASIAFWPALLTAAVIIIIAATYNFVVRTTRSYFESARDAQNVFMSLVSGLVDGFKELNLHQYKSREYQKDVDKSAGVLKDTATMAELSFVRAFLVGESSLILLLGFIALAVPRLFPEMNSFVVLNFIVVFLYLIGPVNSVLSSVPSIVRLRVSWNRIQSFLKDVQIDWQLTGQKIEIPKQVQSFEVINLGFSYQSVNAESQFTIGPINFSLRKGDIMFIVGGNGSGKTTLAKVLTGLYQADQGKMLVNNSIVEGRISEYFSVVFNPSFLFEKLYIEDIDQKGPLIAYYLKQLDIKDKVSITDGRYSTIKLSSGQRKRLALLQCYLEDSPIYLFDEWAADQDPGFRNFFYRVILPEMSRAGKIIITITHDDHYFDVANYIVKMQNGSFEPYSSAHPSLYVNPTSLNL